MYSSQHHEIRDVEARLNNNRKVVEEKIIERFDEMDTTIDTLKESLKKKASQSDVDRLKKTVSECTKNVDHSYTSNNVRRNPKPSFNATNKQSDTPYNGEEVVLIMDSNMNHVKAERFWKNL